MCGRTCLTLQPDEIICACKYKAKAAYGEKKDESNSKDVVKNEKHEEIMSTPEWRAEFNCGRSFMPSYNIAPTDITPVLVSADHFIDKNDKSDQQQAHGGRIIVPMMWGMIPFWHKGDYKKHGLTTNNCRLEHMLESKLYAGPFKRGQRCVVLCEGFYEWQTTKTAKPSERAAHLVYMPQMNDDIKIYDNKTWSADNVNLLKMAGLFDVWTDENGDKIYSYSIITFESTKLLSWMHHRMPAILETEEQIDHWLDFKHVTDKQALAALTPAKNLCWHRVSNVVNNSRNKSTDCNKPIEMIETKRKAETPKATKNKTLLSWLNVRKRREESLAAVDSEKSSDVDDADMGEELPAKRPKFREFKKSLNELNYVSSDSCSSLNNDKANN